MRSAYAKKDRRAKRVVLTAAKVVPWSSISSKREHPKSRYTKSDRRAKCAKRGVLSAAIEDYEVYEVYEVYEAHKVHDVHCEEACQSSSMHVLESLLVHADPMSIPLCVCVIPLLQEHSCVCVCVCAAVSHSASLSATLVSTFIH